MGTNFLSVISQAKARIDSLNQQKTTVDQQIDQVSSDIGVATTTLEGQQEELSSAQNALANFQVPEAQDAPDRAAFTTTDEEGNEVFDQAGFDAENAAYEASVRAHDEAVAQRQQLEANVSASQSAVDASMATCAELEQTRQARTGEQATIVDDLNEAMEELNIAEAQQAEAEAAAAQAAQEAAAAQEANAPTNSEAEQPQEEQHFKEVPVQNNKGWQHYAKMELMAEHAGEEGYQPTAKELEARGEEIKQRNIEAGKVNKEGALFVGKDKTILLRDEIDETNLQTGEEAVQAYKDGQEYLAKKAAEEEAALAAEIEANRAAAEEGLQAELSDLTDEERDHIQNAADMSDEAIDDAIGDVLGVLNGIVSVGDEGQNIGKLTGRLAKQYGYKNAQKIIGRLCNTVAQKAGKAVPGMNAAMAGYGVYKLANGDVSGAFDILDVAVSYVPVVGTLLSLVGTENIAMVLGKGFDENIKMLANGDMHGNGFMGGHCRR